MIEYQSSTSIESDLLNQQVLKDIHHFCEPLVGWGQVREPVVTLSSAKLLSFVLHIAKI